MTSDCELLRRFAKTNSEDAFAELVKRHVHLVYSAALRQVGGDAQMAQDAAQTVFADLARKAGSLAGRTTLTGWLYTSAHFAAAKIARTENRRRDREEKFMRDPIHENEVGRVTPCAPDWEQIRPALDDAMHELNETDRDAILFRYFENQPFIQIGAQLGLNENAARMRVERALEKLRGIFAKRGIATAAALASVISANAVQLAPANLAMTLTSGSIAAAGTGTFALMKIMTMTNLKLGFGALAVAGAATALLVQHQAQTKLRDEGESLRQQITQLQANNESLSNRLSAAVVAKPQQPQSLSNDQFNELLKLRGEVGVLQRQASEASQKAQAAEQKLATALSIQAQFTAHEDEKANAMKQLGLAVIFYALHNAGQLPTNLDQITNYIPRSNPSWHFFYDFDFVNKGAVIKDIQKQPSDFEHPNLVVLRERLARQAPDGTWQRIYGFAPGRVVTATSYDGNFDAWEKVNTYSPPPNQ